jgi:hypothetical protein
VDDLVATLGKGIADGDGMVAARSVFFDTLGIVQLRWLKMWGRSGVY